MNPQSPEHLVFVQKIASAHYNGEIADSTLDFLSYPNNVGEESEVFVSPEVKERLAEVLSEAGVMFEREAYVDVT